MPLQTGLLDGTVPVPLEGFDSEMMPVFGMDIFSMSFDPSKGYQVYHKNLADLLLIRF